GNAQHGRDGNEGQKILADARGLGGIEAVIDQTAAGQRQDQRRGGGNGQRDQRQQDAKAIGLQKGQDAAQRPQRPAFGAPLGQMLDLLAVFLARLRHGSISGVPAPFRPPPAGEELGLSPLAKRVFRRS